MKFLKIIFLLLFIYSCNSKTNNSFYLLNTAFEDWYDKNHSTNINYLNKGFHFYNDIYYDDLYQEYINDLKRFQLEMSQLDVNKINGSNLSKFIILEKLIDNLIIVNSDLNISKNAYFVVFDNYYSIYSILENKNLMMNDKIKLLFMNINKNIKNLNYINESKKEYVLLDKDDFYKKSNILFNYLNHVPIKVTSDLNTLDSLDYILNELKVTFSKFEKNSLKISKKVNDEVSIYNRKIYKNIMENNIVDYINYDNYTSKLNDEFNNYNIKLFDLCIDEYLSYNDEPVWINYNDTLNVIKWVVDNRINSTFFDQDKVISKHYIAMNQIDRTLDKIMTKSLFDTLPSIFICHCTPGKKPWSI
mgnify:CR=1 FL=1